MINAYDFDKTIYDGDSSIDIYAYLLKKNPLLIRFLPKQIFGIILYKLKRITKKEMKEKYFIFLKGVSNIDDKINLFWEEHKSKIKDWYLENKQESDVIISASPEFLLKPITDNLNVRLIATKVNKKTGKFETENCYAEEKVKRFKKEYRKDIINKFYTDSLSDLPMIKISKEAYIVNKNKIIKYQKGNRK